VQLLQQNKILEIRMNANDQEKLKVALTPWLAPETWRTSHPADTLRFHLALKTAFDAIGTSISFDEFMDSMRQVVEARHPTMNGEYTDGKLGEFAQHAEDIGEYLRNTKS
jgi:hypothetical protein